MHDYLKGKKGHFAVNTYIEYRFQCACQKSAQGEVLWSDWVYSKNQYTSRTRTAIYEFMNYSLHDESHSVNILQSIERILGRKRVNELSLGDLWLLLNVAYAHDVGMVTEYEELSDLWKDKEFLDYVSQSFNNGDEALASAARHFQRLDKYIKNRGKGADGDGLGEEFFWEDPEAWPLEFRRDITYLMSCYNRMRHGERSKKFFEEQLQKKDTLVNDRLFLMIGKISALHTEDINEILKLDPVCNGFGVEDVHPQFVAVMLRMGDVLDLDNNRFDIFSLRHFGSLPRISVAHFKKHKSIRHFYVGKDRIEVTAESDDFDVCKINQMWFEMLQDNVTFMISHWKDIVPPKLKGCLMGLPVLKVFHKKDEFKNDFGKDFQLDKDKLLDLFTGNNLYDTKLAFIRELVQNALDANRIQLYYELKLEIKRQFYLKDQDTELEKIKPIDLTKAAYDHFPVDITISEYKDAEGKIDRNRFLLQVSDEGIGVDEEGVDAVAHIGKGWRERSNYTKIINEMRQWLRPTGGFGIGIQSAFLVTDEVVMLTKSAYRDAYRITIRQSGTPNNITVEYAKNIINQGTKVQLAIDFEKLNDEDIIEHYGKDAGQKFGGDYFTYKDRMYMAYCIISNYAARQFKDTLMPVTVRLIGGKQPNKKIIQSKYFFTEVQNGIKTVPDYCAAYEVQDGRRGQTEERMIDQRMRAAGEKAEERGKIKNNVYKELRLLRYFYDALEGMPVTQNSHTVEEDRFYMYLEPEEQILRLWNDITETFYTISLVNKERDEKLRTLANYKNVIVTDDSSEVLLNVSKGQQEWDNCPYITNILFDVMGRKVDECLVVSRNRFLKAAWEKDLILDQYVRAYFVLLVHLINDQFSLDCQGGFAALLITGTELKASGEEMLESMLNIKKLSVSKYRITEVPENEGMQSFVKKGSWIEGEEKYDDILKGLVKEEIVLALEAETGKVTDQSTQDFFPGMEEQWRKLCEKIVIIKDKKLLSVLQQYCGENTVLAVPQSLKGNMSCQALRIVNPGGKPLAEWTVWVEKEKERRKEERKGEAETEGTAEKPEPESWMPEGKDPLTSLKREYRELAEKDRMLRPLGVSVLPYYVPKDSGKIYYITPYNEEISRKINEIMKNMGGWNSSSRGTGVKKDRINIDIEEDTEEPIISQKDFLDVVLQDGSFEELCKWVYRHQADSGAYSLEKIQAAYIYYLKRDYQRIRRHFQRAGKSQGSGEKIGL